MKGILRGFLLLIPIGLCVFFIAIPYDVIIIPIFWGFILAFLIWLFIKNIINSVSNDSKNKTAETSSENFGAEYKNNNQVLNSNKESIKELKDNGIISEEEYRKKIKIIEEKEKKNEIDTYIKQKSKTQIAKLKELYDSGILNEQEFNLKKEKVKNKYRKEIETILNKDLD
jgi:uncharacterized membrane protein